MKLHQLQMKLCEVNCGDFIIWREDELVILRIKKDEVFLKDKATEFFKYPVLPELVGKWYTRVPLTLPDMKLPMQESSSSSEPTKTPQISTEQKWCYCNGEESGNMIGCENDDCVIQWFHVECLRIKRISKKAWYCPDCCKGNHSTKRTAC